MVYWGGVLVTVTAAGYLLGRKELPKLAHFVGNLSGRSVGAIIRAKKEFFDATKDNEIVKLQREFQKGIEELNEIRSELTNVGSMARPLQPTSTAANMAGGGAEPTSAAAVAAGSSVAAAAHATHQASSVMSTARAPVRPDFAALTEPNVNRSEHANLAVAELKLAQQGRYSPRIESLEGGADYVAASIVDTLLLEKIKPNSKSE